MIFPSSRTTRIAFAKPTIRAPSVTEVIPLARDLAYPFNPIPPNIPESIPRVKKTAESSVRYHLYFITPNTIRMTVNTVNINTILCLTVRGFIMLRSIKSVLVLSNSYIMLILGLFFTFLAYLSTNKIDVTVVIENRNTLSPIPENIGRPAIP